MRLENRHRSRSHKQRIRRRWVRLRSRVAELYKGDPSKLPDPTMPGWSQPPKTPSSLKRGWFESTNLPIRYLYKSTLGQLRRSLGLGRVIPTKPPSNVSRSTLTTTACSSRRWLASLENLWPRARRGRRLRRSKRTMEQRVQLWIKKQIR